MSRYSKVLKLCKRAGKDVNVDKNTLPEWRWCDDLGMYAIDRDMASCAKTATDWCKEHCYNFKLFSIYPRMKTKDKQLKAAWANFSARELNAALKRKTKQTHRVRLATRGEAINNLTDILNIAELASLNRNRRIWVNTKAWRNSSLKGFIELLLFPVKNVCVIASTDTTISKDEYKELVHAGWSTFFVGDNEATHTLAGTKLHKCGKTWYGKECIKCEHGCFQTKTKRLDIHAKKH